MTDGATILVSETTRVSESYLSNDDLSVGKLPAEIIKGEKNVVLSPDAVANFLCSSKQIVRLDREQFSGLPLVFSDQAEVDDVFANEGGWEALGASTIVRFSRIGFSCDGNQALKALWQRGSCNI